MVKADLRLPVDPYPNKSTKATVISAKGLFKKDCKTQNDVGKKKYSPT